MILLLSRLCLSEHIPCVRAVQEPSCSGGRGTETELAHSLGNNL